VRWRIRPYARAADRQWVQDLWVAAMPPSWPLLQGRGTGSAMVIRASQLLSEAGTRACHIGWASSEDFYTRAGYQPWRRYAMYHSPRKDLQ
jgi:predicted N-acetyltransferase YhbS